MSQDGSCVQLTENGDCARVNNLRCTGHLFRLICIQLERSSNDASRDLPACESGLPDRSFHHEKSHYFGTDLRICSGVGANFIGPADAPASRRTGAHTPATENTDPTSATIG